VDTRRYKMMNATILDGNSRRYENRIVATTDQPRIVAELQASTRLPSADELGPNDCQSRRSCVLWLIVDCCVPQIGKDRPLES
jgi:hypothetical protein